MLNFQTYALHGWLPFDNWFYPEIKTKICNGFIPFFVQNSANVICEQPLAIKAKPYPSNDFMLTMSKCLDVQPAQWQAKQ